MLRFEKAAIVGAPGPTGVHLTSELLRRGVRIRAISRSRANLEFAYSKTDVDIAMADATDRRELMHREEAYGERWVFPGSGPISGRELAALAAEHLDCRVKIRTAGSVTLKFVALFSKDLRDFLPMVPHYIGEMRYDASRLSRLLGEPRVTPWSRAVPTTLDWLTRKA